MSFKEIHVLKYDAILMVKKSLYHKVCQMMDKWIQVLVELELSFFPGFFATLRKVCVKCFYWKIKLKVRIIDFKFCWMVMIQDCTYLICYTQINEITILQ